MDDCWRELPPYMSISRWTARRLCDGCDTGLLGLATIRARNALEQRRVVTRRRWNLRRLLSGKPCGHESCMMDAVFAFAGLEGAARGPVDPLLLLEMFS